MLIQLRDKRYLFIGGTIHDFWLSEPVIRYESPLSEDDTPRPFGSTANALLFFGSSSVNQILLQPYDVRRGWIDKFEAIGWHCEHLGETYWQSYWQAACINEPRKQWIHMRPIYREKYTYHLMYDW